ncbi:hypothetical protein GC1_02695 [Leisingera sp. ANG1]|nr:hypothetical protein RA23_05475 [Leisingera sp. ANG-S3]KIC54625.1 hypothetical protein RA22_04575 [Leisingera sp. ANG-S]KID10609.1 hypothetical protein GC1_02695 [Leisingera sp. ANG1]
MRGPVHLIWAAESSAETGALPRLRVISRLIILAGLGMAARVPRAAPWGGAGPNSRGSCPSGRGQGWREHFA